MLKNLLVVMIKTRFPENIGMVARACANMGAQAITLVSPEWWDIDKAKPLATSKGLPLLENINVVETIHEAVKDCVMVIGTTARTGGWRRDIVPPSDISAEIAASLRSGHKVAFLLGPEDRGLSNEELEHCTRLVSIPTAVEASSLNVAQAALIILYELHKACTVQGENETTNNEAEGTRRITQSENALLLDTLRITLLEIDFLKHDNPDYFLMPLRRFLGKQDIMRHEFDMLMGICRQVRRLAALQTTSCIANN